MLIVCTTEDGQSRIQLRAKEGTVWLTQLEMAELFDATKQNVSLHLKNLFEDGEVDPAATVKESLTVQIEGSREVQRLVTLHNLDMAKTLMSVEPAYVDSGNTGDRLLQVALPPGWISESGYYAGSLPSCGAFAATAISGCPRNIS